MIFRQMLPGQRLILIKTSNTPAPARPIAARRPGPRPDPLLIRLILWLLATIARPALDTLRRTWPPITPEALPFLRLGIVFILLFVGSLAATVAVKGG